MKKNYKLLKPNKIEQLREELNSAILEELNSFKRKKFTCGNCNKKTNWSDLSIIYNNYMENDPYNPRYIRTNEKSFGCPKCNVRNRLLSDESKKKYKLLIDNKEDICTMKYDLYDNDSYEYQNSTKQIGNFTFPMKWINI